MNNTKVDLFDGHAGSYGQVMVKDGVLRYDKFVALLFKVEDFKSMAMHAALGVCGEAGELGDAIKKEHVYGKAPDRPNVVEELGDLRFYMQAVMQLYNISEYEVLQYNADKLSKRYESLTYSSEAAIERADKKPSSDTN